MPKKYKELDTVGFRHRSALKLMTMSNGKTPKGEKMGFVSAVLYLAPHTAGGGKTLCPHSTEACREMCLAGSGRSGLPRALNAKLVRTRAFNTDSARFVDAISADITKLIRIADKEGLRPVVRLNGTSDIRWERLIDMPSFPVQFMDYTKIPIEHRGVPTNYHLTFSYDGGDPQRMLAYLRGGQSVAVVVPPLVKDGLVGLEVDIGGVMVPFIDGDEHDLRFSDPPGSIVLLKPKGHVITDLMRPDILSEIRRAAMVAA